VDAVGIGGDDTGDNEGDEQSDELLKLVDDHFENEDEGGKDEKDAVSVCVSRTSSSSSQYDIIDGKKVFLFFF